MNFARELRTASRQVLREHIVHGHPVDPRDLEGWVYRGTSLGLPSVVARFTWKTFQKTFYREPAPAGSPVGRLLGWNVRLEQDGIDAPSRVKLRDGVPVTEWNYGVVSPKGIPMPPGFDRGLVIDYSLAPNPVGPVLLAKDPLVALQSGSADELLGVSYVVIAGRCIETPTYFTLEREQPIDYVPDDILRASKPGTPGLDVLRLSETERGWAEALFAAIIGTNGEGGLPAFGDVDRTIFWRCFDESPPPLVRAGLRPMVHLLTFMPLVRGFGRPFHKLSHEEQARFLELISGDSNYPVRQALITLKTLACFAYFDDPTVRAHIEGPQS